MSEKQSEKMDICLNPHTRLCPKFDNVSIAEFQTSNKPHVYLIVDNCAEEHIM